MNTQLTFRLAQTSDFDEILKLSEGVYDGQDYLPVRFHNWMQMDNVAVMLAHTSEKLVGLVQCSEEQQFEGPRGHHWSFVVRVFQKAIRSNEPIRAKTIPECTARDIRIHSVSFPRERNYTDDNY